MATLVPCTGGVRRHCGTPTDPRGGCGPVTAARCVSRCGGGGGGTGVAARCGGGGGAGGRKPEGVTVRCPTSGLLGADEAPREEEEATTTGARLAGGERVRSTRHGGVTTGAVRTTGAVCTTGAVSSSEVSSGASVKPSPCREWLGMSTSPRSTLRCAASLRRRSRAPPRQRRRPSSAGASAVTPAVWRSLYECDTPRTRVWPFWPCGMQM